MMMMGGTARAAVRLLLVLAAATVAPQAQARPVYYPPLWFSGACNAKNFLNGLVFTWQGNTKSGAPWYQVGGKNLFIYYDPDCSGTGDGSGRWIVDTDAPNTLLDRDLDEDGRCDYLARVNSKSTDRPPISSADWSMTCTNGLETRFVVLADVTTTSTTTTQTSTSTTGTRTSTTSTKTATTTTRTSTTMSTTTSSTTSRTSTTRTSSTKSSTTTSSTTRLSTTTRTRTSSSTLYSLVLYSSGACRYKGFLSGMAFQQAGYTASGAPYFKALNEEQYIYHDVACDGKPGGGPRWVIDADAPNISRQSDLDQDGACNYHGRAAGASVARPPTGGWRLYCGHGWVDATLVLSERRQDTLQMSTTVYPAVAVQGALCEEKSWLTGARFELEGYTASSAPYFKAVGMDVYLYHDRSCDGGRASPRWVIDHLAPDLSASVDLDRDGTCDYHARSDGLDTRAPPEEAMWHVSCGAAWRDVWVTLRGLPGTSTTTAATTTAAPAATPRLRSAACTRSGVLLQVLLLAAALVVVATGCLGAAP